MEIKTVTLGQKIKRYRLINDIRQEDMAEKMAVSRATLINYEKGHTSINMDVLNRLKSHYPDFDFEEEEKFKPKIISDNTIDFKVIYDVLVSKSKNILLIGLLFGVAGFGSSYLFNKQYKAEISLYPAKKELNQGLAQFQSLAINLGMNTTNKDQSFNIPDVVKSRLIATKSTSRDWKTSDGRTTDLVTLWKLNKQVDFFKKKSNKIDSLVIIEKAIKKFNDHVNVSEDRLTGLIRISTTFQDPKIAANIANFIGNQVELYIQKENSAQSTKEKKFIAERLSVVKNELEKAELELKNFKERNRGYQDSPELFMIFSQVFREVEAKKEVYLTLQQQLELARIEEVKRSPILHVLDNAVVPTKKSSPNRKLFLIFSSLIGIILSSLRILIKY